MSGMLYFFGQGNILLLSGERQGILKSAVATMILEPFIRKLPQQKAVNSSPHHLRMFLLVMCCENQLPLQSSTTGP